ncbi:uncharacterized protein L201_003829 [Kwoniella dendrophila CBS 6074]|uniref:Tryptophan synthase beta chain-like PALP domain-containing protein n=1 Tax=Kwoniella dendrophila CBS 6074 TaxID=1295534 RepID=A0AAX4JVR1_9TREE
MSFERYTKVYEFHDKFFPNEQPSPLVPLKGLEKQYGCKQVYLKNEAKRFGLPAFKILGASWGTAKALSDRTGVDVLDFDGLKNAAEQQGLAVYAATDGNHGRAVARTAKRLGLKANIYTPKTVEKWSIDAIASEGCNVTVFDGDYDNAVKHVAELAEKNGDLVVQDTSWKGYETIPQYIVDGYTRLFAEIEDQLPSGVRPTHTIVPVGVGSLALASALSYENTSTNVVTVEPNTAACLKESLAKGKNTPIQTGETIMPGLNCGTVSEQAWPLLHKLVKPENAISISDQEARDGIKTLAELGVQSGPCGAAPLAALKHLKLDSDSVVVLICTEGNQE